MSVCMNGHTDCTQQARPTIAQHTHWASLSFCTDCRAGGASPHALTARRFNGSSKLTVQKLHHRHEGTYVRSDLVFRPRKHCVPASARAVPVLVNAMLTIHLTHITARCCQVYGQTTPATCRPLSSPPVIPLCMLTLAACIGTSS